jgi:hypothetical protein
MNEGQARQAILDGVKVTSQMVSLAKSSIRSTSSGVISSASLIDQVLTSNGLQFPAQVCIHPSQNPDPWLAQISGAFSWALAASEAIWSLVNEGFVIPNGNLFEWGKYIGWTDAPPGGGGTSSGWSFPELSIWVPVSLRCAPSLNGSKDQVLMNGDIYLRNLGVAGMHQDVSDAVLEAIQCFRAELFTASVAMLGKASEGAWLELGKALVDWFPNASATKIAKQILVLEDQNASTIKKIEAVKEIYNHRDITAVLEQTSEVSIADLRTVAVWSDAIRDSRNTIHFGVAPALPNTHEKVSALLIGAVPHLRVLYKLRSSAVALIFAHP